MEDDAKSRNDRNMLLYLTFGGIVMMWLGSFMKNSDFMFIGIVLAVMSGFLYIIWD